MKSIALPKTVLDQINSIFFRFVWKKRFNNKRAYEKVRRSVMSNDYDDGGLRMIDMHRLQVSIMLKWVNDLIASDIIDWKSLPLSLLSNVGGLVAFKSNVPSKLFIGLDLIPSIFWRKALCTWLDLSVKSSGENISIYDPIFNNIHVRYNKNTLFLPSSIRRGILTFGNIITEDRLLTFDEFKDKYGDYPRCVMDYVLIRNAVKNLLGPNRLIQDNTFYFQGIAVGNMGRYFYYALIKNQDTPLCVALWKRKYGISIEKTYWNIIHQLKESRLRALCWKIVHNIYPTNILLFKMKLKTSMNCTHCNVTDFVEHFFFKCEKVRPLWNDIIKDVRLHLGVNLKLTEATVLLGIQKIDGVCKDSCLKINHAIAIGKVVISKFRYGKMRNIIEIYESESRIRNLWSSFS